MKKLSLPIAIALFFSCTTPVKKESVFTVEIMESINIPMPEYYRKITGYDSIQLLPYSLKSSKGITANFCYPNQWEFNKFKIDTTDAPIGRYRLKFTDTLGKTKTIYSTYGNPPVVPMVDEPMEAEILVLEEKLPFGYYDSVYGHYKDIRIDTIK